jgi:hypothetical protein
MGLMPEFARHRYNEVRRLGHGNPWLPQLLTVRSMTLWDYRTGKTISLSNFPNAKHPLPVIPSIESMKVCPLANDRNFKAKLPIIVD